MHQPGIEPGSTACFKVLNLWKAVILPLNHRCLILMRRNWFNKCFFNGKFKTFINLVKQIISRPNFYDIKLNIDLY